MREQLNVVIAREQKLKELFAEINSDTAWRDEMDSFANALCAGVIFFKNRYTMNYLKDEGGLTDEYELTGIDKKPYGDTTHFCAWYFHMAFCIFCISCRM